ncbi:probable phospholipid-transporting ATPase 4 [Neltuma alba]|uniref:probable phospholipid-transporting ATPase 4 n=1 Tax=Neltuma alba TaxID=207710 RepID=UPI0010A4E50C|nr:probable phospholipid-transporting ATPase 4 [Prosopis alba]
MGLRKLRAKIKRSHLYTFACLRRTHTAHENAQNLQGPGFSRVVHCNHPHLSEKKPQIYCRNDISTTKYNVVTFLPKALYEQFRRVANIYFLVAACLSASPISPFSPVSMIAPLAFVVGLSMAKEALEDWRRFRQDVKVNHRNASVHKGNGVFTLKQWQDIVVGDVVKVDKDQFFPADLLFLSSSYEDGICYVETMNLDGETNLKVKRSLEVTMLLYNDESFKDFTGIIRCEDPNPSLYTFVGNFEYEREVHPIEPSQILLRDSKLRNTDFIYGVVIFTGHESKVMQNSTKSPSKRSRIERKMDYIIYLLFTVLILISLVSSVIFAVITRFQTINWWYLMPMQSEVLYDPNNALLAGLSHLVTALILYGYLIPISLYVSIEVVKVLQANLVEQDLHMYHEETGTPACARTSNLNEELGQVDTILSDKTGTLTCNQMDFLKCSIAGAAYGVSSSEVELATAQQMALELEEDQQEESLSNTPTHEGKASVSWENVDLETVVTSKGDEAQKATIKGFRFEDGRLMNCSWLKEPNPDVLLLFFRILAVCHTAIPELNEETGALTYEAESPDEGAFLAAAREFGFDFCKRTQASVFIHEKLSPSEQAVEREYKILNLLDFTSKRKRMTVIVRDEEGSLLLMCKGADSIIFDRLAKNGKTYLEATTKHLNEYGENGLRTLALAYRKLDEEEYNAWNYEFQKAKTTVGPDREAVLEELAERMEKELILVGATAVEDKLQNGVPQCIDKLAQAGLKIWVLTGDKMETAINIGFSCSLLRQGMKQICISIQEADSNFDKEAIKESILNQIINASQMIKLEKDPHAAFALIIDGKALAYTLEDDMKHQFLGLAVDCASVICCRVSPKQKALVTRLVKEGTGKTTLGIGDGANDVGMIQEADIGVGISGVEGMQAVMASDFAIAQFRFLERLLVIHGHWCYKRIAQMICYFFYKNIAFGLTIFYFEAMTSFSGQSVYDDWYMILFNVVLTSLPVISLGVFEQDVPSEVCLQFPALYQQGPRNLFFDWYRISGWMLNGLFCSLVVFLFNICIFYDQAFRGDGRTSDMAVVGTTMFTCVIWAVNCQIAFIICHVTWMQYIFIIGSIAFWYIFLVLYGMLSPTYSKTAYQILLEVLSPAPVYWLVTCLVTVTCNFPYYAHICFQRWKNPLDHHIIREIKHYKKDVEDQRMWKRERSKARQKTNIGFSARVEAKMRNLKQKLQKKQSTLPFMSSPSPERKYR